MLLSIAVRQMPNGVELENPAPNVTIPFDRSTFSSVIIVGVAEYVADQKRLLKDLHRLLVRGGKIVIAVPRTHLFSFLDMGNWKFVFPKLHECYMCRTKRQEIF